MLALLGSCRVVLEKKVININLTNNTHNRSTYFTFLITSSSVHKKYHKNINLGKPYETHSRVIYFMKAICFAEKRHE